MKLGRKRPPPGHHAKHKQLGKYLDLSLLPTPPASADYTANAESCLANILANDTLGDCVIAGAYHVVGVATGNAGNLFTPTLEQVLADYSAIGGYVIGDESTDQGCDETVALAYWQAHGFANGTKLSGWLAVDPTSLKECQAALWLFENLYFGVELPAAWVSPMPSGSGFLWDVAGDPVEGNGHCFVAAGYSPTGFTVDSWGLFGTVTPASLAKYCTPAANGALYTLLTPDIVAKGASKAPSGFDWATLVADFDDLGGGVTVPT